MMVPYMARTPTDACGDPRRSSCTACQASVGYESTVWRARALAVLLAPVDPGKLLKAMTEFGGYIRANGTWIPNAWKSRVPQRGCRSERLSPGSVPM